MDFFFWKKKWKIFLEKKKLENFPWLNRVGGSPSRPVQISEPPGPNRQTPPPHP